MEPAHIQLMIPNKPEPVITTYLYTYILYTNNQEEIIKFIT